MLHGVGTAEFSEEAFRAQVEFLSRVFHIISLDEALRTGFPTSRARPKVVLTFDDGLRNNYTVAYPVLRELGVPATFFVCPGLIDTGRWAWNYECRARLIRMSAEQRSTFGSQLQLASEEVDVIVDRLKSLPHATRLGVEKQLFDVVPAIVPTESERLAFDTMNWSELKKLDPALITIGGHSSYHEILTQLELGHLEREVGGCKAWLERELCRPVLHFCYPDGAYNPQVIECVGRHFLTAVTTEKDFVPRRLSKLRLPRIPVAHSRRDLAWRIHRPTG